MIFDQLCRAIEKDYPQERIMGWLKRAAIMEFPGRLHDITRADPDKDWHAALGGQEFLLEHFFLPMPVVAVEDTASCVVLVDSEPDQRGLDGRRFALECMPMRVDVDEFGWEKNTLSSEDYEKFKAQIEKPTLDDDAVVVSLTEIRRVTRYEGKRGFAFEGRPIWSMVSSKRKGLLLHPLASLAAHANAPSESLLGTLRNAMAAYDEVMYFNQPGRFIVERAPRRPRKDKLSRKARERLPKILRSEERPTYITLTPGEIHTRFGLGHTPTGRKTPAPHARRRHYRTLRSERYSEEKRGKTILIPATWVGPEEGEHGGRHYKVRLDL